MRSWASLGLLALVLVVGGGWAPAGRRPSPALGRLATAWAFWLVSRCRVAVASLSRRDAAPEEGPAPELEEDITEVTDGVSIGRPRAPERARPAAAGPRPLMPVPDPEPAATPLETWCRAALARGLAPAQVVRDGARMHGVSTRTAQRAVRRVRAAQ